MELLVIVICSIGFISLDRNPTLLGLGIFKNLPMDGQDLGVEDIIICDMEQISGSFGRHKKNVTTS
jgi:hypothetical protein